MYGDERETILKPIFGEFQNSSKTLINSEIDQKKKNIRSMIVNNLGTSKHSKFLRRPSGLKLLAKGLKQKILDKKGDILFRFPALRREVQKGEQVKETSLLDTKIDLGPLTYLYFEDEKNLGLAEKRLIDVKKNLLRSSNIFTVRKLPNYFNEPRIHHTSHGSNYNNHTPHNHNNNSNQTANRMNKTQGSFKINQKMSRFLTTNTKETDPTPPTTIKREGDNEPDRHSRNIRSFHLRTINPEHTSFDFTNIQTQRKISKKIEKKIDAVGNKQRKMEKKLFRIIDRANYKKPRNLTVDKDLETILDAKIKKRKKKGETKELYISAVKIKDNYEFMNPKKAALLKLSDSINTLTDEMALKLADRLVENYYKKAVAAKVNEPGLVPDIIKKKQKEKAKKLRMKIQNNNRKIEKMSINAQFEKNQLLNDYAKLDERIKDEEEIKSS